MKTPPALFLPPPPQSQKGKRWTCDIYTYTIEEPARFSATPWGWGHLLMVGCWSILKKICAGVIDLGPGPALPGADSWYCYSIYSVSSQIPCYPRDNIDRIDRIEADHLKVTRLHYSLNRSSVEPLNKCPPPLSSSAIASRVAALGVVPGTVTPCR